MPIPPIPRRPAPGIVCEHSLNRTLVSQTQTAILRVAAENGRDFGAERVSIWRPRNTQDLEPLVRTRFSDHGFQLAETFTHDLISKAEEFLRQARAENTRRAYGSDWRHFEGWCQEHHVEPCPALPQTVTLYLTFLSATHKVSTLTRRLSALSQVHRAAGVPSPTGDASIRLVMAGIRRRFGTAASAKRPVLVPDLQAMVAAVPDNPLGLRDRAILLLGFSGAFRRSELVGLNQEDLLETGDGLVVTLRRSKTDQEAEGQKVAIPRGRGTGTCPVRALSAWLTAARITTGPIFRRVNRHEQILPQRLSGEGVAIVVKRWAVAAGFKAEEFAGHSLRAGLATAAAIAGKSERAIMNQTGHRSPTTVRRYIRDGNLFRENAADGLGL